MKKPTGKILLAGGSGLVGTIISKHFKGENKSVHILSRSGSVDPFIHSWHPEEGTIEQSVENERFDAVINLCGAGIADKRWTQSRKKVLYKSRIMPTTFLWSLIKEGRLKADRFIQVSASGFYGNRPEPVFESDPPGSNENFMVRLTTTWEKSFLENAVGDIAHCCIRLGVVISSHGGFIDRFLMPVRLFTTPFFGNGKNYISWIHEDDLASMVLRLTRKDELSPIYNLATPHPVTSFEFSQVLKKVFNQRALAVRVPEWSLNLLFGEMKEAILADVQMMPGVFKQKGYDFKVPEMEKALQLIK